MMNSTSCSTFLLFLKNARSKISTLLRQNGVVFLFDWFCCTILGIIAAAIHCAPAYKPDDRIVPFYLGASNHFTFPTELLYPYKDPLISTPVCTFLVAVLPSLVILLLQMKIRSLPDFHVGTTGLVKAVLSATIASETVKHFVGGFRPHYIEVCQPDLGLLTNISASSNTTWWMSPAACTGAKGDILQALLGFPSGHSATSFASAVFLTLYLNGKLKPFSDLAPGVLDLATVLTPLLLASLISGSQYITHQHHAHEIFAGGIMGVMSGVCSYRLRYAAIFDFRYNHIPLTTISSVIDDAHDIGYSRQVVYNEKLSLRRWWARLSERGNSNTLEDHSLEASAWKKQCIIR